MNKVLDYMNLAVGNNKKFNHKSKGYRTRISLSIITAYLVFFVVGLLMGDLSMGAAMTIEDTVSMFATIIIAVLGTSTLYNCWHGRLRSKGVSVAVVAIMGAQAAYVFELFSLPIINVLFEFATITSMAVLYMIAHNKDV